ncbi:MAG: hypothetical protein R2697_19940 [Ilumatobacteraceae bacterium]
MPLFASTSAANASQVDMSSGLIVNWSVVMAGPCFCVAETTAGRTAVFQALLALSMRSVIDISAVPA